MRRSMGRTCGIFRLTTVYSSMAGHGGIWLVLCVYQYTGSMAAGQHGIPSVQDSTAGRKHGIPMQQWVYLCTICEHSIQPPSPELRNARVRVSRARACVRYIIILLYYYNIIILLYLYIPNISNISSIPNIPNISNNGNIAL